jgi:hypothetical protein
MYIDWNEPKLRDKLEYIMYGPILSSIICILSIIIIICIIINYYYSSLPIVGLFLTPVLTAILLIFKEAYTSKKLENEVIMAFINESVQNWENVKFNIDVITDELEFYKNGDIPFFMLPLPFEHEMWDLLKFKHINKSTKLNFRAIELLIYDSIHQNSTLSARRLISCNPHLEYHKTLEEFDNRLLGFQEVLKYNLEDLFKLLKVKVFELKKIKNLEEFKIKSEDLVEGIDFSKNLKTEDFIEEMDFIIIYHY